MLFLTHRIFIEFLAFTTLESRDTKFLAFTTLESRDTKAPRYVAISGDMGFIQ